jgi:hypothetical protein
MNAWVYRSPSLPYLIAKKNPFGYQIPSMDRQSGGTSYTLQQGYQMTVPESWDWKTSFQGQIFAMKDGIMYDITDLERFHFIAPR